MPVFESFGKLMHNRETFIPATEEADAGSTVQPTPASNKSSNTERLISFRLSRQFGGIDLN